MEYNHQQPTYQQPTHLQQNFTLNTDAMILSNELQNAISAVSVVRTSTLKTAKEFELGSLQKEFNLFETSGVWSTYSKFRHVIQCFTANINSRWKSIFCSWEF
jgi:hypothetical protein